MNQVLDQLLQILNYQLELYSTLLQLAREEQKILVENRSKDLEPVLEQEDQIIFNIEEVDKTRRVMFQRVASMLGIERDAVTLQKLIGRVVEPYSTEFSNKYNQLAETIDDLNNVNQLNSQLINNSLDYTRYVMDLITQGTDQTKGYDVAGLAAGGAKARLLDYNS